MMREISQAHASQFWSRKWRASHPIGSCGNDIDAMERGEDPPIGKD